MPSDFFRKFFARAAVLATALFSPFGMIAPGSDQAISVLSVAITSYTLAHQVGDLFAPFINAIGSNPSATRKTVDIRRQTTPATAAMLRFHGEPSANGSSCFDWRPWTDGESGERWPQLVKGATAEEI
jgi:hypothetical protein